MQALRITTEVTRTTPPVSGRSSPGHGAESPSQSPSMAQKSRMHFWSKLFQGKAQQDRGLGVQPKSRARQSSLHKGSCAMQQLQHSKTGPATTSRSFTTMLGGRAMSTGSSSMSNPVTQQLPDHSNHSASESTPYDSPTADRRGSDSTPFDSPKSDCPVSDDDSRRAFRSSSEEEPSVELWVGSCGLGCRAQG
ncbi:hypothetical protein DUNSADRAFT_3227 [Dunaliella salina]|nr:hypothetical protein DUNSADRAFT_3227 [Dunaliella salina]|eukprot:KAF5826420.1 hypothetical protein DUNSADRAFT_3227 [Dunaliella salina]